MTELQAYSCDSITGQVIDRIPVSDFKWSRWMSAGDTGSSVAIPLGSAFKKSELRALQQEWTRLIVLERGGVVQYMGYTQGCKYRRGAASVDVKLRDWWALGERRGAWDHAAPNVEKWSTSVTGNLAQHAAAAVLRGRSGVFAPPMAFPMTIPGMAGGSTFTRKYWGYNIEYVADVLDDLMGEGLDIYFKPRWIANGEADWLMNAGKGWRSDELHEFIVTAPKSEVSRFSETIDGARVTNNAHRLGEGSEVDMLVRSQRNFDTPYPLLSRTTSSKNVSDAAQLSALAGQDLAAYAKPTSQWEFDIDAGHPVDVGDRVRLGFYGDSWMPDGFYTRRVVGVRGDLSDMKTVVLQDAGGA